MLVLLLMKKGEYNDMLQAIEAVESGEVSYYWNVDGLEHTSQEMITDGFPPVIANELERAGWQYDSQTRIAYVKAS